MAEDETNSEENGAGESDGNLPGDEASTPKADTDTVDYESTIAKLTESLAGKDVEIANLTGQLTGAQAVNATLLRQIGSTAAPDAHKEVARSISINDVLYGTDD